MITPYLEKLIHCGEAVFKTVAIGGSQKHIIAVPDDKFVIITNLQYFPGAQGASTNDSVVWFQNLITQVNVFSKKSFNSFLFRNELHVAPESTGVTIRPFPGSPVSNDVYMVHEEDVTFTFSLGITKNNDVTGVTNAREFGFNEPLDYGRGSDPGAQAVRLSSVVALGGGFQSIIVHGGRFIPRKTNRANFSGVQYPIHPSLNPVDIDTAGLMPLMNVQYVEINNKWVNNMMSNN